MPFRKRRSLFDELLGDFFDEAFFGRELIPEYSDYEVAVPRSYKKPVADIWETNNAIKAVIDMPGVNKEDIKINVKNEGLEIKAEKKEEKKEDKKGIYREERRYTGFYRFIPLPENAIPEKTEAEYKNGVLELTIPKREEEKKEDEGKRIQVR